MRIVLFHPVYLPPRDYGGVERVVLWLAQGLRDRGHEVWIGAQSGSRLPNGIHLLEFPPGSGHAGELLNKLPDRTDLVHFHAPPEPGVWEKLPCAALLTVHGNGKAGESFPRNTVFLSRDHAERHGASTYVHNGIDPAEYRFHPGQKGRHYLFLSKTSWRVKNLSGAVRRCRRVGAPLWVAGGHRPWGLRLRVGLTPGMRWLGPVAGERKAEYLAGAAALVFPVRWAEPFGLVVVESLMSGTPVLASRLGSLPELLPAQVGDLIDPEDEASWEERLREGVSKWDPERCRAWALERFHFARMAECYEGLYRRVISGDAIQLKAPRTRGLERLADEGSPGASGNGAVTP